MYVEKKVDGVWTSVWPTPVRVRRDVPTDELASFPGVWGTDDEEWASLDAERASPLFVERNYTLFGALAGVRGDESEPTICAPKGWPADAAPVAAWAKRSWDADAHSCSWLTLRELLAHDWAVPVYNGYCEHFRDVTLPAMQALGAPDDVRIVFFFDN